MKKLKFLIYLITAVTISSCKDFLDEENKSNINSEEYYKTAEGYPGIVNASYASLRSVYSEPWLFCAGTDLFVEGRNAQPEGISEYRVLTPDEASVTNFYRNTYAAILRFILMTKRLRTLTCRYEKARYSSSGPTTTSCWCKRSAE